MKLNLGCGDKILPGYRNIDKYPINDSVRNFDLEWEHLSEVYRYSTVEEILMHSILEHLQNPYEVLLDLHKILRPKGMVSIIVPHFSCADSYNDLQHTRAFGVGSFYHKNLRSYYDVLSACIIFPKSRKWLEGWANKHQHFYEYALSWLLPAMEIRVTLIKKMEIKE